MSRYPGLCFPTLLVAVALVAGCALPSLEKRSVSSALTAAEASRTRLGEALAEKVEQHGQTSGIHVLDNPRDAFAARVLLARAADRTIDVQYYIWQNDVTGTLLLQALSEAAERGVRVRILLDDNGTSGLDDKLITLNASPNIEVRLFNPFAQRKLKWLGYLTNFGRANRRMHNKSFTADSAASIIGGRNVGDDYFGATNGALKEDLDLLMVGPVVGEVAGDFDKYWASESAYPIELLLPAAKPAASEPTSFARLAANDESAAEYLHAVRSSPLARDLINGELALEWAPAKLISDSPAKGVGRTYAPERLVDALDQVLGDPQRSLMLVSPYFVPTRAGVDAFVNLAQRGVAVSILTNSLEATDVLPVHAGYAKYRKPLLEAGIRLYELRQLPGGGDRNKSAGPFGSSSSSLHAKTFSIDRQRVFVGSFNFDPRSMHLNTELGVVVESPQLADRFENEFDIRAPEMAYQLELDASGNLNWLEARADGEEKSYQADPGITLLERVVLGVLSVLPIEWLL